MHAAPVRQSVTQTSSARYSACILSEYMCIACKCCCAVIRQYDRTINLGVTKLGARTSDLTVSATPQQQQNVRCK
jgi:hypothetical protein